MANDLTSNPLILDTTGSITLSGESRMWVREIVWRNPSTAGHTLTLTINGIAVTRKSPTSGNSDYSILQQPIGRIDSLALTTLNSGTVEVWLD